MATQAGKAVIPFEGEFSALQAGARDAAGAMGSSLQGAFKGFSTIAPLAMGAAIAGVGFEAVKMASTFETATTQIITGAGESAANIGLIRKGLLDLAPEVGSTPVELAKALYNIESAGFHGAAGLDVLKFSAMGAKVGQADQAVVADALTSALNAYGLKASDAASVTNDLIATVANGKMHMADLAGSIGSILAPAAAVHVNLAEVSAAIATMTMQGTGAAQATTYMRQMLISMSAELPKGQKALKSIGLDFNDVAAGIQKQPDGLIATIRTINEHLDTKFPASAAIAKAEFKNVAAGTETADQALAKLANNGGKGYIAALKDIAGGSRQMMGLLELTGSHLGVLQGNFDSINKSVKDGNGSITGWALVQGDFAQKVDRLKAGFDSFLITIGQHLLPILGNLATFAATTLLPALMSIANGAGPVLAQVFGVLSTVVGALLPVLGAVGSVIGFIASNFAIFGPILAGVVATLILFKVAMAIQALIQGASIAMFMFQAAMSGATIAQVGATSTSYALGVALKFMMGWIGLVILAVAAIIAVGLLLITHWQAVKDLAGKVWGAISGFFADLPARLGTAVAAIGSFLSSLPGKVLGAVVGAAKWLLDTGPKILLGLLGGLIGFLPTFLKWWYIDLPLFIVTSILKIALFLVEKGAELLVGLLKGLVGALPGVLKFFAIDLPLFILSTVVNIAGWLLVKGGELILGLLSGILGAIPHVLEAIITLPFQIFRVLASAAVWLIVRGAEFIWGLLAGLVKTVPTIIDWFTKLPGVILGLLVSAGTWLVDTGAKLLAGLISGVTTGAVAVWNWFKSLPGVIWGFVSGAPGWLVNAGAQLLTGLWNGIVGVWNNVSRWFGQLPGLVLHFIGDMVGTLEGIGGNLVWGLWHGIQNVWNRVSSWIKDIPGKIIGWFGSILGIHSPSTVFNSIGANVMQGLHNGLKAGIDPVMSTLKQFTAKMSGALTADGSLTFGASAPIVPTVGVGLVGALAGVSQLATAAPGASRVITLAPVFQNEFHGTSEEMLAQVDLKLGKHTESILAAVEGA